MRSSNEVTFLRAGSHHRAAELDRRLGGEPPTDIRANCALDTGDEDARSNDHASGGNANVLELDKDGDTFVDDRANPIVTTPSATLIFGAVMYVAGAVATGTPAATVPVAFLIAPTDRFVWDATAATDLVIDNPSAHAITLSYLELDSTEIGLRADGSPIIPTHSVFRPPPSVTLAPGTRKSVPVRLTHCRESTACRIRVRAHLELTTDDWTRFAINTSEIFYGFAARPSGIHCDKSPAVITAPTYQIVTPTPQTYFFPFTAAVRAISYTLKFG